MVVLGVGMGFLMQTTMLIAQNSVEQKDLGVGQRRGDVLPLDRWLVRRRAVRRGLRPPAEDRHRRRHRSAPRRRRARPTAVRGVDPTTLAAAAARRSSDAAAARHRRLGIVRRVRLGASPFVVAGAGAGLVHQGDPAARADGPAEPPLRSREASDGQVSRPTLAAVRRSHHARTRAGPISRTCRSTGLRRGCHDRAGAGRRARRTRACAVARSACSALRVIVAQVTCTDVRRTSSERADSARGEHDGHAGRGMAADIAEQPAVYARLLEPAHADAIAAVAARDRRAPAAARGVHRARHLRPRRALRRLPRRDPARPARPGWPRRARSPSSAPAPTCPTRWSSGSARAAARPT